jgi:hypothetical protein
MWLGSITMEQVLVLEQTFAELTSRGWVIPVWLTMLKCEVSKRDCISTAIII